MPFLCGRFEGDGLVLLHRLAAASAYAAVRVDFDAHQRAGELFPLRRERHIPRDGDRFARVIYLLAVLPSDEGIADSRFFDKRHRLAVSRRFRPRFAVRQDVCNRERPGFPNSREFHIFIDGDFDFSVGSGRIAVPLLVLPAREKMSFLCGRFEGDSLALLHRLAAASAFAAVLVDFDAHQDCFIRSDERQWAA